MKIFTKKAKFTYIWTSLLTLFVCMLFLDGYPTLRSEGENYFHVYLNGVQVGVVGKPETAERMLLQARRELAGQSDDIVFMDADLRLEGEEILWGELDEEDVIRARMSEILSQSVRETMQRAYSLKVNEYMVNLGSISDVRELLQLAIDKYATEEGFVVELAQDSDREFSALTADVIRRESVSQNSEASRMSAGVERVMSAIHVETAPEEKDFADFETGLKSMYFSEKVEIAEVYLPEDRISSLETAAEDVIKEQETVGEYKIVSGDTLSEIAIKVNIPLDKIVELNSDKLENENSLIRVGDKLIITVP